MDLFVGLSVSYLVYMAFVCDALGFLARDELLLRLFMLAATLFFLVYYYVVADEPLWDAVYTNGALGLVNLAMIFVVIVERTTFSMSRDAAELYKSFDMLTPGQFRRLMKAAEHVEVDDRRVLSTQGDALDALYFVTKAPVLVEKHAQSQELPANIFIGEIAYLKGSPASATVTVEAGASYLRWPHEVLRKLAKRSPNLKVAMIAQFNVDLMNKVSNSMPQELSLA